MNTIKKSIIFFMLSFFSILFWEGCKSESVITPSGPRSDITRSGKFITFTSNLDGDYDIFLAQVDANGNLVTTGLVYPTNPFNLSHTFNLLTDKQSNWSPDGKILVFSSKRPTGDEDIYAYFFTSSGSIDTTINTLSTPKLLFSPPNGDWDENPTFSPDGKYLIFDRRWDNYQPIGIVDTADFRDIFIGDITGSGNSFTVSNIRVITDSTSGKDSYNPKWSPRISIRKVAYELRSSHQSNDHDVNVLDPLNPSSNVVFYNPGRSGYPAWSPECDNIIFESDQGNSGFYQIVKLGYPTNNGTPTIIAPSNGVQDYRYPTRLPNGDLIAYIQIRNSNSYGNIFLISTSGGTSTKLLGSVPAFDNADNLFPAW